MKKLLKYDLLYLRKTKKILVFFGVFIIFSIMSALTARYIQEILDYFLGDQASPIAIPEPDVYLAYGQYLSDLFELVLFIIMFVAVSVFIRDKTKGLTPLIFSKPINRTKYILSKYITYMGLVFVSIIVGYLVFIFYTYILFDEILLLKGIYMLLLYFLYIAFISAVALFTSTISRSYFVSILLTFGTYLFFLILTIFGEVIIFEYLPGMLVQQSADILFDVATSVDIIWSVGITLVITVGLVFLSTEITKTQDI